MNTRLYSRFVYSMAYVCAVAILAFSRLGIPNDLLIAFAIACLVAGGFINSGKETDREHELNEKMTTLKQEMAEARRMAEAEA
jgi:hypothetical protein